MAHRRGGKQSRRARPATLDESFELFFERNPTPLYIFERATARIVAVNAAALKIYGYTRSEMLRMRATQIRPREQVPAFLRAARTMPAPGVRVAVPGVWRHLKKGGLPTEVSIAATRLTFRGRDCILAAIHEVSEIVALRREVSEFREMWRGVIESAPDYIWTLDRSGEIKSINRVHPTLTREQVIGSNVKAWFTRPSGYREFCTAMRSVFRDGKTAVVQCEFNFPGGPIWFDNRLAPVREDGRITAAAVVSTDISEKMRVEQEFGTSRRLLNSVLAHAPDFIMAINRAGRISFINRLNGFEVVGKTIYELALPESRRVMRRAVNSVFKTGRKADYEAASPGPDGTILHWRANVGPIIENGRVVSAILIARDVTSEKIAADEFSRVQARFRGIFDHSRDAMNFVSREGNLLEANPAMCRMLGYTREELLAMRFQDLTPPEFHQVDEAAYREIERTGEPAEFEKEYIRKDGARIPVLLTAFTVPGPDGKFAGGAAIVRDMTERRRLEREILQTGAREQGQLGRELHDSLGQELTGISLLAISLAKSLESEGSRHTFAARKVAEAARMSVEEVRALAGGLMPAELLPEGLPAALLALKARARRLFGLNVELRISDNIGRLDDVSLIHLYRIAQEAVTNAAKHAKAGRVVITLARKRDRLELRIGDDGVGLRATKGDGLGLKIMRHRCSTLGGTFAARKRAKGGTEIVCSFPFML